MMEWIFEHFFGRKVEEETSRYLDELSLLPMMESRKQADDALATLRTEPGTKITLGTTPWGERVTVPLEEIVRSYGLITGGTGSGKTMFGLTILKSLIDLLPYGSANGMGVVDAKGDLYRGALYLLQQRLRHLAQSDPRACDSLRERVVIYDFSSRDPVSSYNILSRWPEAEADYFAMTRADLLLDLLPGRDTLSLSGTAVLRKLLLLLSEFNLPVLYMSEVLHDESLRRRLAAQSQNDLLKRYFDRQFSREPKPTIEAISRRIEALFASEGVRLALSGTTAPDFRELQDAGRIVLVNVFGETISRSVRRLLQGLVLSDIRASVFARKRKERAFLWYCDEAQNFFATEKLREHMADLLSMSRSFGTYFLYLTQNMSMAVQDPRITRILTTNMRWSFSMRGDPADISFLKPVLPVTGRKPLPRTDPFGEVGFYSLAEERAMALDEIAELPDRVGWFWFKARSAEPLKVRTKELKIPAGSELEKATLSLSHDPSFGQRIARKDYERLAADRDRKWVEKEEGELGVSLEEAYRHSRGVVE